MRLDSRTNGRCGSGCGTCGIRCSVCFNVSSLLSPANIVWGKVIFLHLSVLLFTRGGFLPHCMLGYTPSQTPPLGRPPWADTSPRQTPSLGRHTHWADSPPWADTPLVRHPTGQTPSPPDTMGYGQQAGGTHPTGMHTC